MRATRGADEGFTLIEVVVAIVVLLVVLIPAAYLISSSSSLLTTNRSKTVAVNLATSELDEDRGAADAETWSTGSCSDAPSELCASPALPAATSSQTLGDTVYKTTQTTGWCAETGGTWGPYQTASTKNPAGYGVVVTVNWQGGSVSAGTVLMTPFAQLSDVPTSNPSSNSSSNPTGCPL